MVLAHSNKFVAEILWSQTNHKTKSRRGFMTNMRKKFYAIALAGSVVVGGATSALAAQAQRGNSGLPPGPGNPIAAVYDQVKTLNDQVKALSARVTLLENAANQTPTMWINHLDLVPGGSEVQTLYSSVSSAVGGGLSGLIVMSTTLGEIFTTGGDKFIEKGLDVPPNYKITGVRICYESSSAASFISQVRLAQLQNPPSTALVVLDDGADLTSVGPVCVNSAATSVDTSLGAVRLGLRVNFGSLTDKIVIRGLGLLLQRTHL
jgi:hypothetical protein